MLTNTVGQEIRCNIAVMSCICCVMSGGSAGEHSNGSGVEIIWKLPHSHVWCLPGMTRMSWDSWQEHWHVNSLFSLLAGFWEGASVPTEQCSETTSWLFLILYQLSLLPPDPRGEETESASCWGSGRFTLKESMLDGRYMHRLNHCELYPCIGFRQQGYISCSYKSDLHPGRSPEQGPPVGWAMQAAASAHDSTAAAAGEKGHQWSRTSHRLEGT